MFGWKPDPKKGKDETQDYDANEILGLAIPPDSYSNRDLIVSILDQGSYNSCVANAGMQAVRASHVLQGFKSPPLGSRFWGYYLARAQHGDESNDSGTYIRAFFDAISVLGFPEESFWPYDDKIIGGKERWACMPDSEAFHEAYDQHMPVVYRKIFSTGDERVTAVKKAISQGYCIAFGTDVSRNFVIGNFYIADRPGLTDSIAGGHAMVMAEYDSSGVGIVNSWGDNWNFGGWCKMSWDYIVWENTRDLWIVEHSPFYSGGE